MTVASWLDGRLADAPEPLAARLRGLLAPALGRDVDELPELAVAAAADVVARLVREDSTGRESALDLLAADALATYAFEAAADAPERLAGRARAALERLSACADTAPAGARA